MKVVASTSVADLPFMQRLREAYVSHQSNQFLISGNVSDVFRCPWLRGGDVFTNAGYSSLSAYLTDRLSMTDRMVIRYNIARGIRFRTDADRTRAHALYDSIFTANERKIGLSNFDEVIGKSAAYVFPSLVLLRKLCSLAQNGAPGKGSIAIIFEFADSILPNAPADRMSDADRRRLIFFKEWFRDPAFIASKHLAILCADAAGAVNESIRSLPHMVPINVPLPDTSERRRFIRWCLRTQSDVRLSGTQTAFAELSAGMTLLDIQQIMRLACHRRGKLRRQDFIGYLNRLLISKIGDYVEIVRPDYALDAVVGNTELKQHLTRLKTVLQRGDADAAPTGVLITGPNGVGKTFITMAWAGECNRIVLILKNLRSSWFGETDQIFEKIRNVLSVLGNVMIIVDEADTVFAKPGHQTHATEQRLFGNVISMMSDRRNRSRILWVLMTARPDNLAPDFKRSGRCGLHLPVFDPEGADREAFLDYVLKRSGVSADSVSAARRRKLLKMSAGYSPADFRELIAEFKMEAIVRKSPVTMAICLDVLQDFIPGEITVQRRLQTLQAVMHCSRRSLLPDTLRSASKVEVQEEINTLQRQLQR